MVCVPAPATDGSKVPADESVIPGPLYVPPAGLAGKLLAVSSIQNVPPLTHTVGRALTTTDVIALLLQPFASV